MSRSALWLQVFYTVTTVLLAILTYQLFALLWNDYPSAIVGAIVLWTRIWQLPQGSSQ